MSDTLLSIADLCVERGGRLVIDGLSLTLRRGETVLVTGRNGAGKSTLLRTVAGLLPTQAGTITYGLAVEEVRGVETVHYLGYEDALKPTLTVEENLIFWAAMLGTSSPAGHGSGVSGSILGSTGSSPTSAGEDLAPMEALAAFGIARLAALPAAYLSAGQKRRVALARLLLASRPIWLLDEPLIALDTGAQATLTSLMSAHVATGGTILVASHQPLALSHHTLDLKAR